MYPFRGQLSGSVIYDTGRNIDIAKTSTFHFLNNKCVTTDLFSLDDDSCRVSISENRKVRMKLLCNEKPKAVLVAA